MSEVKKNREVFAKVQVQPAISSHRLGNEQHQYSHQIKVWQTSPLGTLLGEIENFSYQSVIPVLEEVSGLSGFLDNV